MTRLPKSFIEDRRLRDAARAVLADDLARLRAALAEQGIAARVSAEVRATIGARIAAGARDVLDEARSLAGDRKGVLALLVGALVLFLARGPIAQWLFGPEDEEAEGDEANALADEGAAPPAPAAPAAPAEPPAPAPATLAPEGNPA